MIPALVLAAGSSARFGPAHKLLQDFRGRPLVVHGVRAALAAGLAPVSVVLGCRAEELRRALAALAAPAALRWVENPAWASGRASSLRVGLESLPPEAPGAVVFPADLPRLSAGVIAAVAEAFVRTGQLCFPLYQGRKGHPVAFPRSWFPDLCALRGDESAYGLVQARWDGALKLARTDERTQLNLNTPADYERLLREEG